jgi:hypothetical protein
LLRQFTISVAYALIVIAFVDAESYIGELVRGWIEMTGGIVEMVFALVPEPARSVGAGGPNGGPVPIGTSWWQASRSLA